MTEKLDQIEEFGVVHSKCKYNSLLECINQNMMVKSKMIVEPTWVNAYCTNCLRSQLVRELRLLRVTS